MVSFSKCKEIFFCHLGLGSAPRVRFRVLATERLGEIIPLRMDYFHGMGEGDSEKSETAGVSEKIYIRVST